VSGVLEGAVLVKPQGFQTLTSVEEALKAWFNTLQINKPKAESVPLKLALGRVLAVDLIAPEPLPRFDKSAMDGYAVRASDLEGATEDKPKSLKLTENSEVQAGQARQIWTGNPIPKGADTVIMIEDTERKGEKIEVYYALEMGKNVSKIGEDTKKDSLIALAGTRLNPYHLGFAAAFGYKELKVTVKPKIGIIATGNEIVEVATKREPNQIYDANKTMFSALCQELGAETVDFGIVKDNLDEIAQKIKHTLDANDAVITCGGTSVGGFDLVPDAVNKLGKPGVVVHGIALRPAMPTGVGSLNGKPILILSGNPVAAVVGFEVFGRPVICRMLGMAQTEPRPVIKAKLTKDVTTALGRKTYVRVKVAFKAGEFIAEPISAKGAGSISTMTQSNGYLVVDEDREGVQEGEIVPIQMYANLEVQ
jgi:molybdopterin molybdotransferase